jgi:hypothetical protein
MQLSTLARRLGSVAVVASLALGATACSGDSSSDKDSSSADSSSAADDSADTSADDNGDSSDSSTDAPYELSAADFYPTVMSALKDSESFAFESTSTAGGQTSTITGQARFGDSGTEMKASSSGAQALELIMLDQVVYMKTPLLGAGDKWIKIDLAKTDNPMFGMLAKATDPEAMFQAMQAPKKLELVGAEELDGVATNHYRITMDPDAYMKAMGFPSQMSSFLPDELVTEMWVDGDNLPRKFTQTVETPAMGGSKPTTVTTEGLYSDFGLDVDIEAPPASETTDAPALPGTA